MNCSNFVRRAVLATTISLAAAPFGATASFASRTHTVVAPASPLNVTLTSANKALSASWSNVRTATSFKATASANGHATKSCATKKLTCTITSLVNGVSYSVVVVAFNAGGKSAPSLAATAKVGVPGAPLAVQAIAGKSAASIKWEPPVASGVANVTSYTATALPGGVFCTTTASSKVPAARSCVISGLTKGTKYAVSVTATNDYGTSAPSKSASVTSR
jgi:hypothetical protein